MGMSLRTFGLRLELDTAFRRDIEARAAAGTLTPAQERWMWQLALGAPPANKTLLLLAAAAKLGVSQPADSDLPTTVRIALGTLEKAIAVEDWPRARHLWDLLLPLCPLFIKGNHLSPDIGKFVVREELIRQLQPAGPEALEAVLQQVATVPYRGDFHTYLTDAMPVVRAALATALQPTFDALRAESAANRAKAALLEEQLAKWLREFERFRRMATPKTIQ